MFFGSDYQDKFILDTPPTTGWSYRTILLIKSNQSIFIYGTSVTIKIVSRCFTDSQLPFNRKKSLAGPGSYGETFPMMASWAEQEEGGAQVENRIA